MKVQRTFFNIDLFVRIGFVGGIQIHEIFALLRKMKFMYQKEERKNHSKTYVSALFFRFFFPFRAIR